MQVTGGDTDVPAYFMVRLVANGTAATGLTVTNFDLQYTRTLTAAAAKTDGIVGTGGAATHVDNKVFEVNAASSPGLYMVCFEDGAFAVGVPQVMLALTNPTDSVFAEAIACDIDPPVNITRISADATAASNLELDYDGTGYEKANSIIGTCTANTDMVGTNNAALASVCTETRLEELDAANLPADANTIKSDVAPLFSGTADSGTTSTFVDAALTQADTDHWKGMMVRFTSGAISGQCRMITDFNVTSDTVTFAPTVTQTVDTSTYEILPWAPVRAILEETIDPGAALNLAGTTVNTVTTNSDMRGTDSAALASNLTTVDTKINDLQGTGFVSSTDSNEALRNRGDAEWTTGGSSALLTATADSGTTTTVVDTELSQADDDWWNGCLITFTSTTLDGQTRLITGFDQASNTLTFEPAVTTAVVTHTYEIHRGANVKLGDTAHGGAAAVLTFDRMIGVATTGDCVKLTGNGSSDGLNITGGASNGDAINLKGGATNGGGIRIEGTGTGSALSVASVSGNALELLVATQGTALSIIGAGSGLGVVINGGATGHGVQVAGGGTSGDAISLVATVGGDPPNQLTPGVPYGSVTDASATATSFDTDLTKAVDDFYKDSIIVFLTGNLKDAEARITDYDGTGTVGDLTVAAGDLTAAPDNGSRFMIIGRATA